MQLIQFVGKAVSIPFLLLVARRRRLQKLKSRVELLAVALRVKTDEAEYLREQVAGYRDAFHAIQVGYQALGAANAVDRDTITRKTQ